MKTPSYKPLYILVYVVISVSIIGLMITHSTIGGKIIRNYRSHHFGSRFNMFLKFGRWAQEKFYDKFTKNGINIRLE